MSKSVASDSGAPVSLEKWLSQTIARQGLKVQYRLRGNTLHLLCRHTPCLDRARTLRWLLPILQKTDFTPLLPLDQPPIYQVWLYGCEAEEKRPRWTTTIYLNQLDRHLELAQTPEPTPATVAAGTVHAAATAATAPTAPTAPTIDVDTDTVALALSNTALAKQGEELAIASYLSETLNELGVAVRVSAKAIPYTPPAAVQSDSFTLPLTIKRLWIACQAAYSPDSSLLSEPMTQKLRQLELEGFHDAIILFQVIGETEPDWTLRVDLTPPETMLREWARWGDIEAIQRLLNQDIAALQLKIITATQNATTLHLCCGNLSDRLPHQIIEQHKRAKADIALLLEAIAPQGIHAATLYGQLPEHESPVWIEWLDLPATQHPAFADATMTLAKQGDWGAIAFLLHRLLNPDLNQYLNTGGVRLQLLPKHDLLHVMIEASRCPNRPETAAVVVRFMRQLNLPNVAGIRMYGRRSGQKKPLWSYGLDFSPRSRLVPEVTPEFAATEAYVADLLPQQGEAVLRPDLTAADIHQVWTRWQQRLIEGSRQILLRSQLFSFAPETTANQLPGEAGTGWKVGLIWGTAGLLLLLQTNWILHQISQVQLAAAQSVNQPASVTQTAKLAAASAPRPTAQPEVALKRSAQDRDVFNTSSFTQSGSDSSDHSSNSLNLSSAPSAAGLSYTPRDQSATLLTAEILAEDSPLPTFNSQQLDQKLQLYYRYIEQFGVPDVLVVGSSRALRGIDPLALQSALSELGYADAKVFNFGLNGATAQVVNLVVQHLLTSEQLPRLIVWADGARAFNSGATDVTYNGIVASEGYQQLLAGTLPLPHQSEPDTAAIANPTSVNHSLTSSYTALDRTFSQKLGQLTGRASDRDQLKHALQQGLIHLLPGGDRPVAAAKPARSLNQIQQLQASQNLPDETGFLSLAVQFNPATYYQKYARVLGSYDSDYEDFHIAGAQESALQSLLKFTQASRIPLVFVNLPLTEDYLDPVRLEYEQTFRDYMVQLSLKKTGFVFRDLSETWTTQYGYFSDPSHLNRYGAHAVSVGLAEDAKIPWLKSDRPTSQTSQTSQTEPGSNQG